MSVPSEGKEELFGFKLVLWDPKNKVIGLIPLSVSHPISLSGINKREAKDCHHIRHFENTFVVDTVICDEA